MATVEFSHISKVYLSGAEAVKNFNLKVEDGELLVLMGASGSGKSTVLRMVAGLEEITTGELRIGGTVVNDLAPKKRNIAMVFQNYALFPNLTVEENIGFALKMQRLPKKERRERVAAMARTLGVEDLLKRKAKGLSGGQCQRIAIGRALVCRPDVFLLDEPLSNLDASMRAQLREEIARLQQELKVTTLYVTHDQTEAMTLGSRVCVMDRGEFKQVDTPQMIYNRPQNTFVARFVGTTPMNLFSAQCLEEGGAVVLRTGGWDLPLPQWKGSRLRELSYVGKEVTAGLRGEDIYPVCPGTAIPDVPLLTLEAEVAGMNVLGADTCLRLRAADVEVEAMVRTRSQVQLGDRLEIRVASDQIHVFDGETGEAIVH